VKLNVMSSVIPDGRGKVLIVHGPTTEKCS